jgi:hypothetical protein
VDIFVRGHIAGQQRPCPGTTRYVQDAGDEQTEGEIQVKGENTKKEKGNTEEADCEETCDGQDAGNEYARPVVVTQTIGGATVFASANADEHAWNADADYFAVTGCTTFGFASDEHEYAWNADASGVTFDVAANTNEYAGHANAIGFAQPASFPSTKDGHEHADAVGESIGKSDGSNARHGHGWNEHEHGAVACDEPQ